MTVTFSDPVYGDVSIQHEVLQELIETYPVQRLKHINQAGPQRFFPDGRDTTRFQHSRGVMALLRRFGAPIEEQIAGLLHDVPHTAFSHVADFVFETDDHEYHERFMAQIVHDSRIPDIVEQHGYDIDYILDESNFGLLEQDLPDLCGDRIDYFLRDMHAVADRDVTPLMDPLTVRDGRFVLTDMDTAEQWALQYIRMDRTCWANPREVAVFDLFADAIRRALDTGVLSESDLFGTDDEVYATLAQSGDAFIQERLDLLQDGISVETDADDPDITVSTKVRYIDPPVITDNGVERVSERSAQVRDAIDTHREEVGSGYRLRIVDT